MYWMAIELIVGNVLAPLTPKYDTELLPTFL